MNFTYSRQGLDVASRWLERILEIIPALLSWGLLISILLLCLFLPIAGVVVLILFDLYWLFRILYLTLFLILSSVFLEIERKTPWHTRLKDFEDLEPAIAHSCERLEKLRADWKTRYSEKSHLAILKQLKKEGASLPHPKDLFHLVIIPFYTEGISVLGPTVEALSKIHYPKDRIVVVLGVEERAGVKSRELAESLKRKYGSHFSHFHISIHPTNLPGESAVKGANATYAAKWAKDFFESRGISFDHVLVSCFDCDTVVTQEYFACLTYNYVIHPKRTRTSFQPIPVFHNNIWEAPPFARVLETGSSFLQLIEATDPEHLVTFSSHSMSFQALVETNYWPTDLISDDSAIFWKAFLVYNGDYRVAPLYVTLSMDVALGETFWETCGSIYQQKRRWAWGVENFPIFVRGLISNPRIPFWCKVRHAFRLLETNVSWATWTPIMLILSWLPTLVATHEFSGTVAHFNAPRVAAVICNLASASLMISVILSFFLLPKSPRKIPWFEKLVFGLQWLFVPLIATFFGALPALDAQTRLALGRYMEFFVAPKGKSNPKSGV